MLIVLLLAGGFFALQRIDRATSDERMVVQKRQEAVHQLLRQPFRFITPTHYSVKAKPSVVNRTAQPVKQLLEQGS